MKKINLEKLKSGKALNRNQLKAIDGGGFTIPRDNYISCSCGGPFGFVGFVKSVAECVAAC